MYLEIPIVTRCCLCAPLRYGLLLFAYLKFIASMVILGMSLLWTIIFISLFQDEIAYITLMIIVIALMCLDAAFTFVLINGAHNRDPLMLHRYYIYGIVIEAIMIVLSLIWIFYEMLTMRRPQHMISWSTLATISSLAVAVLFAHAYLLILTRSEIVKLKSSCQFRFVNHTSDPECHLQSTHEEGT